MFNILIVLPNADIHKLNIGPINMSFREAPLTATTLASLIPENLNTNIKIIDESVDKIPFYKNFDLVAISCLTGTACRAYEISKHFREKGSKVVLGGVHVTLVPEEARKHADSIVVGFGERTWPNLLHDFSKNELKPEYREDNAEFRYIPVPRRDLQKKFGYMAPNVINATRGCKGSCDFCSVPAAGFGWLTRPIAEVIAEIKQIRSRTIAFNDVSMGEDLDYFKELLTAMIPLKKRWGGLVSTKIFHDESILELLKKSGCVYLLIGFESLNNASLANIRKGFNQFEQYKQIIRKLLEINVILQGCFIFGFDEDDLTIFEKTVDFVNENKISIPRYAIYTPYPNTRAFHRLLSEGRLLHQNWRHYDTQHVVFQPNQMTPDELDNGFKWAFKKTFALRSNLKRTLSSKRNFPITFLGNLAYRLYVRRLFSDTNRIIYNN